jgi:MYXO-CTERM domain-containing protein
LIDPNQFPTGSIDITGLSFRALPGAGAVDESFGNSSLSLSTSPNFANSTSGPLMSTTFANNIGPGGLTQVYSGTPAALSDAGCSGPGVCPFDLTLSFTTPFDYNPANGSLLIELIASGFVGTGQTDAVEYGAPGGPIASVIESGSTTAATGTLNLGDSIVQLTYTSATPEPGSWSMAVAGAFLLFWIGRRRRQSRAHPRRFSML